MNKILIPSIVVCGLMLLSGGEAAAHDDRRIKREATVYDSVGRHAYSRSAGRYSHHNKNKYDYYKSRHHRAGKMPRWLERDKSFRHWLRHSHFRKNHRLSWNQLFDLYRWELAYFRYHRY